MKYLFTAPRFHTNQVPIVKGLTEMGHEVKYFVAYIGATEDHTYCKPTILKPSHIIVRQKKKLEQTDSPSIVESEIGRHFIPDYKYLRKEFIRYMPDVVICREKTYLTLLVYSLCNEFNTLCILYDQEPLYNNVEVKKIRKESSSSKTRKDYRKIIYNKFIKVLNSDLRRINILKRKIGFPDYRMTPVKYRCSVPNVDRMLLPEFRDRSYYIPLVYSINTNIERRIHLDECLNFLCVAKFREYKNLPLLVDAFYRLKDLLNWKLTIVGQDNSIDEKNYRAELYKKITHFGLSEKIQLLSSIDYKCMDSFYQNYDVLILPSRRETYGMTVTEAMANGLAIIVSNTCGVAFNVVEGQCGIVFESGDVDSLENALIEMICRKQNIHLLGEKGRAYIKSNQSFAEYYKALSKLIILMRNKYSIE